MISCNIFACCAKVELYPDSPPHDTLGLTRVHHRTADPLVTGTAGAPYAPVGSCLFEAALECRVVFKSNRFVRLSSIVDDLVLSKVLGFLVADDFKQLLMSL